MVRTIAILTLLLILGVAAPGLAADDAAGHGGNIPLREDLSFWGGITFIVFFLACFKLLGGWASQSLAEREQTENQLIAEAEEKNRKAQQALSEHRGRMEAIGEEIDGLIAEAHRDADHTRNDIRSAAESEADVLRTRARAEITRTRNQALNDLFSVMSERVIEQAERKVKERLNETEHNRLIDDALAGFSRN